MALPDLEQYTLKSVLSHISQVPPTLPPHFVSPLLAQRHIFLNITPEDPARYLLWPSSGPVAPSQILEALQALQLRDYDYYPIQYTSDPESIFAHAHVPSGDVQLRVVFKWDAEEEQWKYHNVALMPFPDHSSVSLEDVLKHALEVFHEHQAEPADEDYWGSSSSDSDSEQSHCTVSEQDDHENEDAYWAQYSAIHGTADSTIPSPPHPVHSRRSHLTQPGNDPPLHDTLIEFSHASMHPPSHDPLALPCPFTLAELLQNIIPRSSHDEKACAFDDKVAAHVSEIEIDATEQDVDSSSTTLSELQSPDARDHAHSEELEALKGTAQSLYRLWRVRRVLSTQVVEDKGDKETFMAFVKHSIDEI
ncbi:hypothetical protein FISHEDRAFT_69576 [Fistulina hepatica ATCC 64428]|uniref:Uncharacterized protein n=1 Tax=Fistulina hepatica ATCC 64428 TaxID=1128425 RepID=A0A0D7ALZ8_9AGAR|nr:hypothetical protein FISHEDRAFT_69576 [Fistulina hepatica ATCC 64428]